MSASGLPTEAERVARALQVATEALQASRINTLGNRASAAFTIDALEAAGLLDTSEPLELLRKIVAWIDAYGGHPVYEREIRALVAEAATREGAAMAFREPLGESPPPHEDQCAVVPTSATSELRDAAQAVSDLFKPWNRERPEASLAFRGLPLNRDESAAVDRLRAALATTTPTDQETT